MAFLPLGGPEKGLQWSYVVAVGSGCEVRMPSVWGEPEHWVGLRDGR